MGHQAGFPWRCHLAGLRRVGEEKLETAALFNGSLRMSEVC